MSKRQYWEAKKELISGSILGFSLIFLAFFGWYFASSTPEHHLDQNTLANSVDLVVSKVLVKKFDEQGKLSQFVESPLIQHVSNNNTHIINLPHIIIRQTNKPELDIQSLEATSILGGQQITFNKKVRIHQKGSATTQESRLETEELVYFPNEKRAKTDKDMIMRQAGTVIHAKGMNAYLGEQQRVALSKARAIYEPKQG